MNNMLKNSKIIFLGGIFLFSILGLLLVIYKQNIETDSAFIWTVLFVSVIAAGFHVMAHIVALVEMSWTNYKKTYVKLVVFLCIVLLVLWATSPKVFLFGSFVLLLPGEIVLFKFHRPEFLRNAPIEGLNKMLYLIPVALTFISLVFSTEILKVSPWEKAIELLGLK